MTKPVVYYTWACANCEFTYESPTVIAGISHLCRDRKRRLLKLATTAHPRGVEGSASLEVGDYAPGP